MFKHSDATSPPFKKTSKGKGGEKKEDGKEEDRKVPSLKTDWKLLSSAHLDTVDTMLGARYRQDTILILLFGLAFRLAPAGEWKRLRLTVIEVSNQIRSLSYNHCLLIVFGQGFPPSYIPTDLNNPTIPLITNQHIDTHTQTVSSYFLLLLIFFLLHPFERQVGLGPYVVCFHQTIMTPIGHTEATNSD